MENWKEINCITNLKNIDFSWIGQNVQELTVTDEIETRKSHPDRVEVVL